MPIETSRCHVLGATITRITDMEGAVTRVICPQYEEPSGICRLRSDAQKGGPLSRLLERVEEEALTDHGVRCEMH